MPRGKPFHSTHATETDITRAITIFVAQMLGGMTAAALVECMFPGKLDVTTTLGGGTSIPQGLFIEMFLTAELVFTVFMLAAEKHRATFLAPIGIGLVFFVIELVGRRTCAIKVGGD